MARTSRESPGRSSDRLTLNFQGPEFLSDTRVAFNSNRDGNFEIYAMNVDGAGQTNLTNNGGLEFGPSWSSDGTKIAFASFRDGNNEVYAMNADGTGQTNLTNNAAYETEPSWSPDGTKIAFASLA